MTLAHPLCSGTQLPPCQVSMTLLKCPFGRDETRTSNEESQTLVISHRSVLNCAVVAPFKETGQTDFHWRSLFRVWWSLLDYLPLTWREGNGSARRGRPIADGATCPWPSPVPRGQLTGALMVPVVERGNSSFCRKGQDILGVVLVTTLSSCVETSRLLSHTFCFAVTVVQMDSPRPIGALAYGAMLG